jgi:hypothetical protein
MRDYLEPFTNLGGRACDACEHVTIELSMCIVCRFAFCTECAGDRERPLHRCAFQRWAAGRRAARLAAEFAEGEPSAEAVAAIGARG